MQKLSHNDLNRTNREASTIRNNQVYHHTILLEVGEQNNITLDIMKTVITYATEMYRDQYI